MLRGAKAKPKTCRKTENQLSERPHQGKGKVILFPKSANRVGAQDEIQCRARLGGLLKHYDRAAG